MKFETLAIRSQTDWSQHQEHSAPIFATSGFVFDDPDSMKAIFADEQQGNIYGRYTNPSVRELETKMALLEGAEDATATGVAAIFTTFATVLKAGDHVLMSRAVFGSTIITHPSSTTHSKLSEEQRHTMGIYDNLIRLIVGLEHVDDIIADFEQALA